MIPIIPMQENNKICLSLVIPVFNESDNIPELLQRTLAVCKALPVSSEIILVDDGSSDQSPAIIRQAAMENPGQVVGVFLLCKSGQHAAIAAGLHVSQGEYVITLDADLQNPPEEIPRLLEKLQEGYDTVGSIREHRQDMIFRKLASHFVNRMVRSLSKGHVMSDYGCMLRGYSRSVVKAVLQCHEHGQFIPMLAMSFAKNSAEITVSHSERKAGQSKYSLWKLFMLLYDLLATTSIFPLRLLTFLGIAIACFGICFGILVFIMSLCYGDTWSENGVFTLFSFLFVLMGFQFIGMGILGEYLGRVFLNTRHRPTFIIREVLRQDN